MERKDTTLKLKYEDPKIFEKVIEDGESKSESQMDSNN
jgi:hypothetical protein